MISLIEIFKILRTGNTPTEKDWKEIFSSIFHKSEKFPIPQVLGLNDELATKAEKAALNQTDAKVAKLDQEKASKEDLANATTNFKGYHSTIAALQTAYPQADNKKDWFAWVGAKPTIIWKVNADGGVWVNTGDVPTEQEVNLEGYVAKSDIKNELGNSDISPIAQQVVTQKLSEKANIDQIATEETSSKKVSIADDEDHEVASWSEDGTFDTVKLSNNLLSKIENYLSSGKERPRFYADVYLIPCYGQSLSINTSAGASTFSSVVPISYDVNMNNTNIQDMCAGTAEMFEIMAEKIGAPLPPNFKMMHCLGGAGGVDISQLSKGTTYYSNVIKSVNTAKEKCDAEGLTLNVPAFTWTQGEEDMRAGGNANNYNPIEYKNKLRALIDDFNVDIKEITKQTNDILCVSYQVGSHTSYKRYPRVAMLQSELAREDNRMIVAKTMYDIEYVTENNFQVHVPARTYRNMGNMYGLAIWNACVMRKQFSGVYPISHSVNGNTISVRFNVPSKPLVLDDVLVKQLPDGNYGFNIYKVDEQNGDIAKSSVQIISIEMVYGDTLLITLDKAPIVGERLTYAINGDYWQNIAGVLTVGTGGEGTNGITKSGNQFGSRGCLRDSQGIKNNNLGAVFSDLYNWSEIFEIKL